MGEAVKGTRSKEHVGPGRRPPSVRPKREGEGGDSYSDDGKNGPPGFTQGCDPLDFAR